MQRTIAVEQQIKEAEAELREHIMGLQTAYPLFAATKYPQPVELSKAFLKENEYVLTYDVTDSALLVYLTKGKEVLKGLLKPVPRKELDELVRRFLEPMEIKPGESVNEKLRLFDFDTGKKLSDLLLAGVIEEVPKGAPLIIVPNECLGLLPFEMLVLNHGGKVISDKGIPHVVDTEFLGDRNPISHNQSINALTLARTFGQPRGTGRKLLVLADPVFESTDTRAQKMAAAKEANESNVKYYEQILAGIKINLMGKFDLSRLPLTTELAESLKRIYHSQSDVFTGFQATKSGFFNNIGPALPNYDKIVFATHGYFGNDMPGIMEPCLVLTLLPPGTDGYLRMTEIMGLKMNTDIVALTACQTGLGQHISGEGTMGMARAFQYAGAKSVLMSLWSVSEITSVELMKHFFKFLNEGKNKLEALQLARSQLRKDGFDHPFFWAAFVLAGEAD